MGFEPLRRRPTSSVCANRNLALSSASTPIAIASQSTRFHSIIVGKPMS